MCLENRLLIGNYNFSINRLLIVNSNLRRLGSKGHSKYFQRLNLRITFGPIKPIIDAKPFESLLIYEFGSHI